MSDPKLKTPPGAAPASEPKTPVGKDYARTVSFINEIVEPRMHKLVEEANKYLAKFKVRVGAEINWLIERVDDDEEKKKG